MMKQQAGTGSVFSFEGVPSAGQMIPLGFQHMVAAVVGIITPAILIADTCGLTAEERTLMIQVSLILTAVATLLQLFPIFGRIGSRLPVIMGISFAYIPTLQAIGGEFDLATILGAEIVGGCVAILFGIFVKWIRPLFPPLVTGTVIFTIGLSLYPTAVRYMAGGNATSEWFGNPRSWAVALITLAVVVFLNNFTKGILKLASILIGMVVGYVIAYFLGIVDLSGVSGAAWFALPQFMPFEIKFVPSACVSLAIVYVVNAVQTIGDLSSTTMGGMDRLPTDKELSGGIIGQGVMSIVGAFFGGLPTASYSQNVGIVTVNRVINRAVFTLVAGVLLVAGLVPKFASILTTIPQCVIGGATISVFATITMTGIRMITEGGFTPRKSSVVGLSVALGVGITQPGKWLPGRQPFPRLGVHRVRLLLRGGGHHYGHPPQSDPSQGARNQEVSKKNPAAVAAGFLLSPYFSEADLASSM
ncbi:uracil-xanthine permease family protein [Intestinimonas timonensis]|uniref:uracil-xanthine permease family protein n=1 Tax=Intestinimonas timonensis TaxID=1689270 RepID=UPI003BF8D1B1